MLGRCSHRNKLFCSYDGSKATTTVVSRSSDQEKPVTSIAVVQVCVRNKDDDSSTPDGNPWNKLDDVMVETVLARIPTADIFRCLFVCKRWEFVIHSPTFSAISNQLFDRRPWFFIVKNDMTSKVYDTEVSDWRRVQLPLPSKIIRNNVPSHPVVASGGLMCVTPGLDYLSVCNPLTGLVRLLPKLLCSANIDDMGGVWRRILNDYVKGVAMHLSSRSKSYKVFVAFGKWPYLCLKVFSSSEEELAWTELLVGRDLKYNNNGDVPWPVKRSNYDNTVDWVNVRKHGVVAIGDEGQMLVYYITRDGKLLGFDPHKGTIFMCPRLNIQKVDYIDVDLVECDGMVVVVALVEYYSSRELSIWKFDHHKKNNEEDQWNHIATMPPNMSQAYYSLPSEINCSGNGDYIMVCANFKSSNSFNSMVMYNMRKNTWVKLQLYDSSEPRWSAWPFSFKPDIEAIV